MIGDSTSEKIKKDIGTAIPSNNNTYAVKGRDLRSGPQKRSIYPRKIHQKL